MVNVISKFNMLKRKNPGMTDEEAMKKAMDLTAASRNEIRKADEAERKAKAKSKPNWVGKLKMGITKQLSKGYHSKAGQKHLRSKRAGV